MIADQSSIDFEGQAAAGPESELLDDRLYRPTPPMSGWRVSPNLHAKCMVSIGNLFWCATCELCTALARRGLR